MTSRLAGAGKFVFGVLLFGCLIAIPILLLMGSLWAGEHLLPTIAHVGRILFAVDLLILLPLSLIRRLRPATGGAIMVSAWVFGLTAWLAGFVLTYMIWGMFGIVIGLLFFGIGVVPLALLATAVHGAWQPFGDLLATLVCAIVARLVGVAIVHSVDTTPKTWMDPRAASE